LNFEKTKVEKSNETGLTGQREPESQKQQGRFCLGLLACKIHKLCNFFVSWSLLPKASLCEWQKEYSHEVTKALSFTKLFYFMN
jgi:hypothetical protein